MKKLADLSSEEARSYFLKGDSYFNGDFPEYIRFDPVLSAVDKVLNGKSYSEYGCKPFNFQNVNYQFVTNKDGRFAWRPYELMHPAIYVSLVNTLCKPDNWKKITERLDQLKSNVVECCSSPVLSDDIEKGQATQVRNWWQRIEQRSLSLSLQYTHVMHTDVTDCYGSLYTHSISWALHERDEAKKNKNNKSLLGNQIDSHLKASRYGQTNGICQGSVLMDFIAELVLAYADKKITQEIGDKTDFHILRYRDDYRIFTNSDTRAEEILKVVSNELRCIGMKLSTAKTILHANVIEGSIKPDKLAGINLQDLGEVNAKVIQKKLLRLHSFGKKFPNSGALRRLVGELHTTVAEKHLFPEDLEVQVAIATDIAVVSPLTFPAIAAILSHLISHAEGEEKERLWKLVEAKMKLVPHNGYLEVWMQRVTKPNAVGIAFNSTEPICQIVNGEDKTLWNNDWINSKELKVALAVNTIVVKQAETLEEAMKPEEIELFKKNSWFY